MSVAEKFMFEISFDEDTIAQLEAVEVDEIPVEEEEPEEIVPTFSEEEVEQARQQGFEAGKQEGLTATSESLTKHINESLMKIDSQLTAAIEIQNSANEEMSRAALSVALGICNKVLPTLANRNAFGEVEHVIEEVFSKILEEPTTRLTVHPDIAEMIEERFTEMAQGKGYQGQIFVQADAGLGPSDCKVEWSNGGSERNTQELWREITAIVDKNLGDHPTIWDEPENMDDVFEEEEPSIEKDIPEDATAQLIEDVSVSEMPIEDESIVENGIDEASGPTPEELQQAEIETDTDE